MRPLLCLLFLSLTFVVSAPAVGAETTYKLEFEQPANASSPKVAEEMAQIISRRLKKRFKAAGVKDFDIRPGTRKIAVTVGGDFDADWLTGLAVAPGALQVRPVMENVGPDWRELTDVLPSGVEIRGESARGYLWSATRAPLDRVLKRLAMAAEMEVVVAPDVLGWRTIVVGDVIATEADLEGVSMSLAPTGAFNVTISFKPEARARLAARPSAGLQTWAVILDDEVVSLVPRPTKGISVLGISAPGRLGANLEGQSRWASSIVGRLAAPMPVRLAIFKE